MNKDLLIIITSLFLCAICPKKVLSQVVADVSAVTPVFRSNIESDSWLNYSNKPSFVPKTPYTFILKKGHLSIKSTTRDEILFDVKLIDITDDMNLSSNNIVVKEGITDDKAQKISFYMDMSGENIFGILKITPNSENPVYGITIHLKNFKFLSD